MPDRDIIRNLNQRINDSQTYWNDAKGFDLKNQRAENTRMHLGKIDESGLYKHQKQYKENQIFVGEESIVSICHIADCRAAGDSGRTRRNAQAICQRPRESYQMLLWR
jgi:hypothetical protein